MAEKAGELRVKAWHIYAAVAFFLLAGAIVFLVANSEDPEKVHREAVMEFNPDIKLDESGRVVELRLEGRDVTDEQLDHVKHFPELRQLSFYGSLITDAGLEKIRGLKKVEALNLGKTQVTDRGLKLLENWYSVKWLWYSESDKITPGGIAALEKARPGLTMEKN